MEFEILKSQFVTSRWGGTRYQPFAFTEHGVTMLSSVLKSERAVSMSIQVVRAFVAMRTYLMELASTSREIAELKERVKALEMGGDENLKAINDLSEDTQQSLDEIYIALTELSNKHKVQDKLRRPVGFIKPKDADHK